MLGAYVHHMFSLELEIKGVQDAIIRKEKQWLNIDPWHHITFGDPNDGLRHATNAQEQRKVGQYFDFPTGPNSVHYVTEYSFRIKRAFPRGDTNSMARERTTEREANVCELEISQR